MYALPLACLIALAGCSLAGSGSAAPEADATLVNATEATIWPLAVDAETATLIDIAPEVEIDPDDAIAPGDSAPLTIEGYEPGDGVVVFVYRVEGTRATFATTLAVDGQAFRRADGVGARERVVDGLWRQRPTKTGGPQVEPAGVVGRVSGLRLRAEPLVLAVDH